MDENDPDGGGQLEAPPPHSCGRRTHARVSAQLLQQLCMVCEQWLRLHTPGEQDPRLTFEWWYHGLCDHTPLISLRDLYFHVEAARPSILLPLGPRALEAVAEREVVRRALLTVGSVRNLTNPSRDRVQQRCPRTGVNLHSLPQGFGLEALYRNEHVRRGLQDEGLRFFPSWYRRVLDDDVVLDVWLHFLPNRRIPDRELAAVMDLLVQTICNAMAQDPQDPQEAVVSCIIGALSGAHVRALLDALQGYAELRRFVRRAASRGKDKYAKRVGRQRQNMQPSSEGDPGNRPGGDFDGGGDSSDSSDSSQGGPDADGNAQQTPAHDMLGVPDLPSPPSSPLRAPLPQQDPPYDGQPRPQELLHLPAPSFDVRQLQQQAPHSPPQEVPDQQQPLQQHEQGSAVPRWPSPADNDAVASQTIGVPANALADITLGAEQYSFDTNTPVSSLLSDIIADDDPSRTALSPCPPYWLGSPLLAPESAFAYGEEALSSRAYQQDEQPQQPSRVLLQQQQHEQGSTAQGWSSTANTVSIASQTIGEPANARADAALSAGDALTAENIFTDVQDVVQPHTAADSPGAFCLGLPDSDIFGDDILAYLDFFVDNSVLSDLPELYERLSNNEGTKPPVGATSTLPGTLDSPGELDPKRPKRDPDDGSGGSSSTH